MWKLVKIETSAAGQQHQKPQPCLDGHVYISRDRVKWSEKASSCRRDVDRPTLALAIMANASLKQNERKMLNVRLVMMVTV